MPQGRFKSRTFRRVFKRIPRGISKLVYEKRKTARPSCASCKRKLLGIPTGSLKKLSKTQKRPQRSYGGIYCSKCSREKIKSRVRKL